MTTSQTVGRLWARYLKVRNELNEGTAEGGARREVERRAGQLRYRLVVNYSPLVKYVANQGRGSDGRGGRAGGHGLLGRLGLARRRRDLRPRPSGKRAKFESYAISKIRWAILDELRGQDWVPRRVRLRAQEVEKATTKLVQELRRSPMEVETPTETGMGVTRYRGFLEQYSRAQVASLKTRLGADEGIEYEALVEDPSAVESQSQANREELRSQLVDAISEL